MRRAISKRTLLGWLQLAGVMMLALAQVGSASAAGSNVKRVSAQKEAARRADLDVLQHGFVARSGAFTARARADAHQSILAAKRHASSARDIDFFLDVARVIALSDNGHDSIDKGDSTLLPALALPVRLVWMGDELVITRARGEYSELVGARVERLGTLTPRELFLRYREYQGGKEGYRRINPMWLVHNPAVLAAIGATADAERTPVTVELQSGKRETRLLFTVSSNQAPHLNYPAGSWSTYLSEAEKAVGWTALGKEPPLYLQQADKYFRMAELPKLDALYVQFRINMSMPGEDIEPFIATVSKRLATPPTNAVVDLRFDTGGDIGTTLDLMRQIGRRIPGRIFVITGPYTFSAGIVSTAALLQAGGKKVTIVGEDVGDRTHWWSEHKAFCLPHSKVCAAIQTGYWDLIHGCREMPHCYGDQFGIRIGGIRTDIPVSPSAADWRKGRDPAMAAIARSLALHRFGRSAAQHPYPLS